MNSAPLPPRLPRQRLYAAIARAMAAADEAAAARASDKLLDYIQAFGRKTIG